METCLGCGVALTRRSQLRYCSNKCQFAAKRMAMTEQWLLTGHAPHAGSYHGHYIRTYLFEQQSGLCAVCAIPAHWNGEELRLVLDHIDGDSSNNHRENLRLVCPNCDSQLPTFKARNRGKGRAWRKQRYADGKSY